MITVLVTNTLYNHFGYLSIVFIKKKKYFSFNLNTFLFLIKIVAISVT
nr:MAG TPA: hypothetical protein [Caudoviricetes sp.]